MLNGQFHNIFYSAYNALRMARTYAGNRHLRVVYQERAADYRATLVDIMRRRAGWTLAEIVAGRRL